MILRTLFVLCCFAFVSGDAAPRCDAADRPNILWLITEDMGPQLGCYGTREVATPVLDDLAARGMRFQNAFSVTPVCSTSRSSFCTGMYAISIGAHQHRTPDDRKPQLAEGVQPITRWMEQAGYYTCNMAGGKELNKPGKVDWNFQLEGKPFQGSDWSELKGHQPFYAQINHSQSHRAFTSPTHADPAKVDVPPYYPDHPVIRQDWAKYLDEITEVDGLIGDVLKRLEADGLADNTIVFMFGDHGQAHVRGKQWPYDSGLRIPLIVYVPPAIGSPAGYETGSVSRNLVESIDVAATTLALAGIPKPSKMEGRVLFGPQREPPREFAFASRDRCDMTTFRLRTARDAEYRYIRNFMPEIPFFNINAYKETSYPAIAVMRELHEAGKLNPVQDRLFDMTMPREELYRVSDDPHEIRNLIDSGDPRDQAALTRLRGALDGWLERTGDKGAVPEPMEVRLKIFAGYLTSPEKRQLVRLILEQQQRSSGISPEYAAYLDEVEKLLVKAEQDPAPEQPRRRRNQAAGTN
jgi:N-sulfoglucosamine sulfohydrolase